MRLQTFFITYFAYVTIHMIKMSIPFTQLDILKFYGIKESVMGWLNGALYLMSGFSYCWAVFRPLENLPKGYFYLVGFSAVVFMLIPITMFLGLHEVLFLWLGLLLFGWFHAQSYSIVASLISRKYDPDHDGLALGIWSTLSDMGNIIGFLCFILIVYGLHWDWKFCIFVSGFLALVMSILMLTLDDGTLEDTTSNCQDYGQQICDFFSIPDNLLAIFTVLVSGASMYGVLLWLPMFLEAAGFQDFEGYISMAYSISTLIGTSLLGKLYELIHKPRYHLMILCGTISIAMLSFIILNSIPLDPSQKYLVLLLIGIAGFSLGTTYNISFSHEIFLVAEKNPNHPITFIMNILNWWLNFFIAITQVLFGFVSQISHQYVFLMLIVLSFIVLIILLLRLRENWNSPELQPLEFLQNDAQMEKNQNS